MMYALRLTGRLNMFYMDSMHGISLSGLTQNGSAMIGSICIHCKCRPAVHVHHNPPKGLKGKWVGDLCDLCLGCHEWAHKSTRISIPILRHDMEVMTRIWQGKGK